MHDLQVLTTLYAAFHVHVSSATNSCLCDIAVITY